jgi:hypothetical protein
MSVMRAFAVSALGLGLAASNIVLFAGAAGAQQPAQHDQHKGKPAPRNAAPAARPSPQIARPAQQVARPAPQAARPATRFVGPPVHQTPPPVRYAAPAPRQHHEAPHRHWNGRRWGYGAAAAGFVILGSAFVASRRSDLRACANDFETFDWDTGTIINEDGERELCPYLQ